MRPTLEQVYRNPEFFVRVLTEHGVENAQAKITRLQQMLVQHFDLKSWLTQLEDELRNTEQAIIRWPRKGIDPSVERMKMLKRAAPSRKTVIRFRQSVNSIRKQAERKIAAWPDLSYDESQLTKSGTKAKVRRVMLRQISRRRRSYF